MIPVYTAGRGPPNAATQPDYVTDISVRPQNEEVYPAVGLQSVAFGLPRSGRPACTRGFSLRAAKPEQGICMAGLGRPLPPAVLLVRHLNPVSPFYALLRPRLLRRAVVMLSDLQRPFPGWAGETGGNPRTKLVGLL